MSNVIVVSGDWAATHEIICTDPAGRADVTVVMLTDRSAYTRAEWDACDSASWSVVDGGWYCEGQTYPAGGNGSVEVIEIAAGAARED